MPILNSIVLVALAAAKIVIKVGIDLADVGRQEEQDFIGNALFNYHELKAFQVRRAWRQLLAGCLQ